MKEILRELGKIYRCFDSISNIEFKRLDLAKGQYSYLVRICENPGIIQERVADMLKVDRTTAARSIQKLEKAGFVYKENMQDNRKSLHLFPTEKGKDVFQLLQREEEYSNRTALRGMNDGEKAILLKLLQQIRTNLEDDWSLVKKGGQRKY